MLYFLISSILIPKLKPVKPENSRFALNLLSRAKIQEATPPPPPPIAEPEMVKLEDVLNEIIPIESPPTPAVSEKKKPVKEKKPPVKKIDKKITEAELAKTKKEEEEAKKRAEETEKQRKIDLQRVFTTAIYDDSSLNNASPKYPIIARKEGEEGEVILLVKVDVKGNPVDVVVFKSSGYERLDNASMYAVKNWKFKPAKNKFGGNVESVLQIPFQYKISDK